MAILQFPVLIGLGFNWVRRPMGSTSVQAHASGLEGRAGYWANPMYEWDLTFDVLRDFLINPTTYTNLTPIVSEIRRIEGFFMAMNGNLTPFLLLDPDDSHVTGQFLGTGDGAT